MATTAANINVEYPLPVYRYTVQYGDESIAFSEVSGLEIGRDPITYKDGLGFKHMPGMPTDINITLKKGIVRAGSQFYDWIHSISLNEIDKKDITISLTNESADTPVITWVVSNAFPSKLTAPSFDATSNEVAVETLELRADDITISY